MYRARFAAEYESEKGERDGGEKKRNWIPQGGKHPCQIAKSRDKQSIVGFKYQLQQRLRTRTHTCSHILRRNSTHNKNHKKNNPFIPPPQHTHLAALASQPAL